MTYREEQFMKQMTEIAIEVAELRAENKLLKSVNDSLIQALHKPVVSGKRPDCPYCMEPISERMIEEWTNWLRNAKAACASSAVAKGVSDGRLKNMPGHTEMTG